MADPGQEFDAYFNQNASKDRTPCSYDSVIGEWVMYLRNPYDLRGLAADKPAASAVIAGTTYWSVDTNDIEISDGTNWRAV